MTTHRNFDAELRPLPKDGPTFDLGGETFHCVPLPPGEVMSRLTGGGLNVADFIRDCLLTDKIMFDDEDREVVEAADDRKRWQELMTDPGRPIPVDKLVDVVIYLAKEYGDRPTLRSSRS